MVRIPNVNTSLIYILVVRQQNVDDAVRAYTLKVLCEYVVIKGVCCKVKISQANSRALFKLLCCLVFPVKRLIIFLTYFFFFFCSIREAFRTNWRSLEKQSYTVY